MSVRRLAKEQPASFAFSKDTQAKAEWWIKKYPENRRQSAVIPILWLVQKQEVLAFVQARPSDGGAGALMVLLNGS